MPKRSGRAPAAASPASRPNEVSSCSKSRPANSIAAAARWLPDASSIGPVPCRPVECAVDIAGRQAHRDQQSDHHPEQLRRLSGFAACRRDQHRADETDRNAGHAEKIGAPHAEQDRQHQRDHRRQREHDAGVAGAEMRDGGKHQQVGNGVGDRRGDDEVAQPVRRKLDAASPRKQRDQKDAAGAG